MEEEHFEKSHLSIQQQAKRQLEEEEAHLVERSGRRRGANIKIKQISRSSLQIFAGKEEKEERKFSKEGPRGQIKGLLILSEDPCLGAQWRLLHLN